MWAFRASSHWHDPRFSRTLTWSAKGLVACRLADEDFGPGLALPGAFLRRYASHADLRR